MFTYGAILASALLGMAPLGPPSAPLANADVPLLFKSLEGRWSCAGAFANNKPLSADLEFRSLIDGQLLHYHHADRPPTSYIQDSVWGMDKESGTLVSLAWIAARGQPGTSPAFYVAEEVSPTSVTFVHHTLLKAPWAANRFRYTVSGNALQMVWEVQKQGTWQMGDTLKCTRAP